MALLPTGRSNRIAAGTIGTLATRTSQPMWCSSSHFDGAGGGVEAERAAAREDDRVDLVDHVERVEQIGFARARRAAALRRRRRARPRHRPGSPCSRWCRLASVKLPTLRPSTAVSVSLAAAIWTFRSARAPNRTTTHASDRAGVSARAIPHSGGPRANNVKKPRSAAAFSSDRVRAGHFGPAAYVR